MSIEQPNQHPIECDELNQARTGDDAALGQLLESFRPYLQFIARQHLSRDVQTKLSISDIVQETLLEACTQFIEFHGHTWEEFRAWLRKILIHNLSDVDRFFRTLKRDVGRELRLDDQEVPNDALTARSPSPSSHACRNEEALLLDAALHRLQDPARSVLILRHRHRLSFEVIAQRLNFTNADAARKCWLRALDKLRHECKQ